ncbi:MAG: AzlD domain-containing protein [Ruminococcaceae bacterium]|nr:AzlD domain-containing protein [Oscillospiraceae bacterium]
MSDSTLYLVTSIAVMALVTYMIRMLPLAVFRKKIKSQLALNFLYYVPFAVLSAMTIPAVFTSCGESTAAMISSAAGFCVALLLAYFERGLLTVAVSACAAAFVTDIITGLLGIA